MTRLFIILLISPFLFSSVRAQHKIIPIPPDSAIWISLVEDWHEGEPPQPHSFEYHLGRTEGVDTIINGKLYHCYFGDYINSDRPLPPVKSKPAKGAEWFRYDTLANKVYYLRTLFPPLKEELMYDFTLKKGDTVTDTNCYYLSPQRLYPYKIWVDDIDSVYWLDGTYRYRWWFKSTYGAGKAKAVVVEGMGYTTHLTDDPLREYHPLVSLTKQICCFKSWNTWLYKSANPWNADCDSMVVKNIIPSAINNVFANELNEAILYPNPVSAIGVLNLNSYAGNINEQFIIEGYSISGQKILNIISKPGDKIYLSNYNFSPSLVFFTVRNKETVLYRQKVILQ